MQEAKAMEQKLAAEEKAKEEAAAAKKVSFLVFGFLMHVIISNPVVRLN